MRHNCFPFLLSLALVLGRGTAVQGQAMVDYSQFEPKPYFEDEFDYTSIAVNPASSTDLTSRWDIRHNYQLFPATPTTPDSLESSVYHGRVRFDPSQLSIETFPGGTGKFLRLKLTRTAECPPNNPTCDTIKKNNSILYKAGIICSKVDLQQCIDLRQRYGLFEMRARIPAGPILGGLWLSGQPYTEIDLMEGDDSVYADRTTGARDFTTNIHFWGEHRPAPHYDEHPVSQAFHQKPTGSALSDDFHTYSVYWTPTRITFFFDNRELRTIDYDPQGNTTPRRSTHDPSYIIANLAMGTPGDVFVRYYHAHPKEVPQMDIDYIRVWKPKNHDYSLSGKFPNAWLSQDIITFTDGPVGRHLQQDGKLINQHIDVKH